MATAIAVVAVFYIRIGFEPEARGARRATPASAAGGGKSKQGLAQRSKSAAPTGAADDFGYRKWGCPRQLQILLPLPNTVATAIAVVAVFYIRIGFEPEARGARRATPASAAGGGKSKQGLAQRSKSAAPTGAVDDFGYRKRGCPRQLQILLPLPNTVATAIAVVAVFYIRIGFKPEARGARRATPASAAAPDIATDVYDLRRLSQNAMADNAISQ